MRFTITASPSSEVVLSLYDANRYPTFRTIFEAPEPGSRLFHLSRSPEEAEYALVLENRSEKAITALRYQWLMTGMDEKIKTLTAATDSYMVDVFRPVVEAGARQLISPSGGLDESLIAHVQRGGGSIGGGTSSNRRFDGATDVSFAIELILFADGEIAGPDPDRYALELNCRKPAAEFVAKQIRLAEAEQRDGTPVLAALAKAPHLRNDPLAHWTQHYADYYLSRSRNTRPGVDMAAATLRHLENRPSLPKFYRRESQD